MERWNGWGDVSRDVPVSAALRAHLEQSLGGGDRPKDAALDGVLRRVAPSRALENGAWSSDPLVRLRHARGQGFPDLVALRSGAVGAVPDAVAHPGSAEEVRSVLAVSGTLGAAVIPYGGGTSVVGGVSTPNLDRPVVVMDLRRMQRLRALDSRSLLATFGAGVTGPNIEARLRARGLTLGHYPQSFEHSTLGGWVATRSSGQQSLAYGRIEDLFAGGFVESPGGPLCLPPFPASAAGPDLRQVILGSEGRLGVITEVTVRVRHLTEVDAVFGAFLPTWEAGLNVARGLAQESAGLSMVRLSSVAETETALLLAGRSGRALGQLLALRRLGPGRCMLLVGVLGSRRQARAAQRAATFAVRAAGGVWTGGALGRHWQRQRFRQPYLRHGLWAMGYGVDTVETAAVWSGVPALVSALEAALHSALQEPVHVGTHLSHVYPSGSSVYSTFVFRLGTSPEETVDRWRRLKTAAMRAVVSCGGTITHHHGVGTDHREALTGEKGSLGIALLSALTRCADPDSLMNPGKLLS